MLGPLQVSRRHSGSTQEAEVLRVTWSKGRLTVFYARRDAPDSDQIIIEEWEVECASPRVRARLRRDLLMSYLDDLEQT